jgi:putative addiction module component (TIGR02574 family)
MSKVEELEQQALNLEPEDRERLAGHLLQSLESAPLNAVDHAWIEEAERRYQDFKSGKTQGVPGEQVFAQIRQELGWPR